MTMGVGMTSMGMKLAELRRKNSLRSFKYENWYKS
jgi:hypothetical protein